MFRLASALPARLSSPRSLQLPSRSSELFSSRLPSMKLATEAKREPIPGAATVFSESENMLRESVARFAKEVVAPKAVEMDEKGEMDKDILQQCFANGMMGIETPTELHGAGMSFTSSCIVIEELAKADAGLSVVVDVQNTLVNTAIRTWGRTDQQRKYLPRLATDTLGSFCLSEWGSGSDAFALQTKAVREGSHFVLNGTKAWITNAKEAGVFLVMANADPSKGYKGITAFLVERSNPGLRVGKKEQKMGIRASSTCEVTLENCRVSEADVLGPVGQGYKIAISSLNEGRIGIAAQMLGLAQGVFDKTMPYVLQRKQFGKSISEFQGMQFQYATLAMDIYAARLMVYNAARLREQGLPFVTEASMAKLYASQAAERVASKCIELAGGIGFIRETGIEKYYRDCKIGQIYEGTSNIQLQTIAKEVVKFYSAQNS